MTAQVSDPKGLIRESYLIEGISDAECRSILIDWALSLAADADRDAALVDLLARHAAAAAPDHPMTRLLIAAQTPAPAPRRRGGRQGRIDRETP